MVAILDRLPYMALVLTAERTVVYANQAVLDTLGPDNLERVLASRPGELFDCIQSRAHAGGCGGAEGCRHCLTSQIITDCLHRRQPVIREVRVSARRDGRLVAYDFKVTASPLELSGHPLVMVFFEDISARKRREHLESIFIHDLLNTVGSLQMLSELLQENPAAIDPREFERQVQLLTDEIRAQQLLIQAEQGKLSLEILCVPARHLLEDTVAAVSPWSAKRGIALVVDLPDAPLYLATDPLVARRVLLNAVKNAIEASSAGDSVKISASDSPPNVTISIWNARGMAESTRHQVFQRSFSTKGEGRGLGTYSMRLLMENYLGGQVSFTSDTVTGTTFNLVFPSMREYLARAG